MIFSYMPTLSVPLTRSLDEFVDTMVKRRFAPTKSEVVRRALVKLAEDQAVADVLQAEQELIEGKVLYGDLRKLAKSLH